MAIVRTLWPHSVLGPDPEVALATWEAMLADATAAEVSDALHKLAADGREHAPPVGVIAHAVAVARQSVAPGFDDFGEIKMRTLGRAMAHDLYRPNGRFSPEDTALAVAIMQAHGVHEAVLRFVVEQGLRAFVVMPHGDMHALDPGQSADSRDFARHYRNVTVPGWQRDPRGGVALDRACRAIGADPADVLAEARATVERLRPVPARPALPAPEDDDDGPMLPPGALLEQWRSDRARAKAAREAEAEAKAEAARAAQRAALAELAEHNGQEPEA